MALEKRIDEWRSYMLRHPSVGRDRADELETLLRSEVDKLESAGLDEDEAFLVAVKRIGKKVSPTPASSQAYAEQVSKWLLAAPDTGTHPATWKADALVAVGLAVAAAIAFRMPELFGIHISDADGPAPVYMRNFGFFILPFLAAYFGWKRTLEPAAILIAAMPFAAGMLVMNVYPFTPGGHTEVLASLHILIALWLAVGYAHCAGKWRDHDRRMDFIRFSGEWFIYYVLIALGGGTLTLFTVFIFEAIGLDAENLLTTWVIPSGVAGAVIIAAALVEARQNIAGNLAPMLTMLFTPLFTLVLLVFLGTVAWTGSGINLEREFLIGFDLVLVLVLGLILYSISARDLQREPGFFDALQLVLVVCALLVDALALWAILERISVFGFSPNRVAALGLNIILVVNLGWAAVLHAQFLTRRNGFARVVRWQTVYLPVYAVWAGVVVVVFPPVFGFV